MAKRTWLLVIVGVLAALTLWFRESTPAAPAALSSWTRVVALAPPPFGIDWAREETHPGIAEAAAGFDPERLRKALLEAEVDGLWVAFSPDASSSPDLPLSERFAAGGVVRSFRGEYLTPEGLLYVVDDTQWPAALSDRVLARVARGILEGKSPPELDAFPEPLRRIQAVEVLVLLRGSRGPRLWRSARAESIVEGLVTASLAARKRWDERSETMGGPLDQRLDELDVEVALLFDDGTFDPSAISLIDVLIQPMHGVAYEQPSRWRYLLPKTTHTEDTPTDAYRRLFRENGLSEESFDRADLRLYRLRMHTVSVDHGSAGSRRAGAPSDSDAESPSSSAASSANGGSGSAGSKTTKVVP